MTLKERLPKTFWNSTINYTPDIMDDNKPNTPDPLKYDRRDTFILDRPFIFTQGKTLVKGMPYLYNEVNHSIAVRLLDVRLDYVEQDEFVNLSLQVLQTNRCFKVAWNLDYEGDYYLWSLADLESIMNENEA